MGGSSGEINLVAKVSPMALLLNNHQTKAVSFMSNTGLQKASLSTFIVFNYSGDIGHQSVNQGEWR